MFCLFKHCWSEKITIQNPHEANLDIVIIDTKFDLTWSNVYRIQIHSNSLLTLIGSPEDVTMHALAWHNQYWPIQLQHSSWLLATAQYVKTDVEGCWWPGGERDESM